MKKLIDASLVLGIFVVLAFAAGALTSFYTVEPDEEAVVLRLGKYIGTNPPGLHFKFPWGIDQAIKVKTKLLLQEEFGFRTRKLGGKRTGYSTRNFDDESLMLTGDLNVADVEWIVQYQIAEPEKFLFHTREPRQNIRDAAEAVMRRVVGDRSVDEILTTGRAEIATESTKLMREVLKKYDMGIKVVSVKLQDVNPPEPVKASFNEVNEAKQDQDKAINQAEKEYNKIIPREKGRAEEEISKAKGYAISVINRAKGDAAKFRAIARAYQNAPTITKERLYIEALERIFSRVQTMTIVDEGVKGLLPIFENNHKTRSVGQILEKPRKVQ